jgi:LuxR family maltose regulon positive regulatory protein
MTLKANENIYVAIVALCMQEAICTHRGKLEEAGQYYRDAIRLGEEHALPETSAIPATCLAYRGLAEIHYFRNEVDEASQSLEIALELARQAGNTDMIYNIFQLGAWLALLVGDRMGTEQAVQKAVGSFPRNLVIDDNPDMLSLQVASLLAQGKSSAAIEALGERGISAARPVQPGEKTGDTLLYIHGYLLLARALLLEKKTAEAFDLVEKLLPLVEAGGDVSFRIEAHLLMAVVEDRRNHARPARMHLDAALRLAEPAGFVSLFLNIGQPLYELLRQQILSGGLTSGYAQKLLAAFAGQGRKGRVVPLAEADRSSGADALTRQEAQVLHLLAGGLSSSEVASELVIAVSTARSYIKSIHRKLNAHSREEALARGKQLGLI